MRTDLASIAVCGGAADEKAAMVDVGTVTKTDGTRGAVLVKLRRGVDAADVFGSEFMFVVVDGAEVPLRVADFAQRGDWAATVTFANVASADAAMRLVGCAVRAKAVGAPATGDEDAGDTLVGYAVVVEGVGEVGTIEEVDDSVAANPLFVVGRPGGGELMIPATADFVVEADDARRRLVLRLPDGLLDLDEA